jgi:hypothetical protein
MKHLKCFGSIRCAFMFTNSMDFGGSDWVEKQQKFDHQPHLRQSHDSLTHTGCQDLFDHWNTTHWTHMKHLKCFSTSDVLS